MADTNGELTALSLDELAQSCEDNGLTSLICEQDFNATLEDVLSDNPEMEKDSDNAKVSAMERMLEENLEYGALSDDDDTDDDHSERLGARWDIIETIAIAWVFGKVKTLSEAQAMCNELVAKWQG